MGKWIARFRRDSLLDEIRAFRSSGGRTGLVSDYPARQKLESLGVAELFDVVIANGESDGPSWIKPNPSGYLRAAEHLGVAPSRCLVIGDREDADGEAAGLAEPAPEGEIEELAEAGFEAAGAEVATGPDPASEAELHEAAPRHTATASAAARKRGVMVFEANARAPSPARAYSPD